MLLTKESDYALRIVKELADGEQKKMKDICASERIPTQFAYKILKKLEKGGVVKIVRGVKGGCRLDTDLEVCSLYQILEIMGEKQVVNGDVDRAQEHLLRIQENLDEMLKKQSLAELLQ